MCPKRPCEVGTMVTELQDNRGAINRSIQWNRQGYLIPTNTVGEFNVTTLYHDNSLTIYSLNHISGNFLYLRLLPDTGILFKGK